MRTAVEPRVVYSTNELLSATNKDVLPALQKSNVIYQFSCHCDSRYVGCSSFKDCRTESNNMSPNLSVLALLPKNAYFLLVGANLPPRLIPSLLLLIQPFDFIFCKILLRSTLWWQQIFYSCPRPLIFSFICSWSHFHQNFQNRPLPTKRICLQLKDCTVH